MSMRAFLIVLAGAATACGSTDEYVYRPEEPSVNVAGAPGQKYAIPPEAPTGEVRVASNGVVELRAPQSTRALHVRAVVDDEGDATPWVVDANDARVQIAGAGESRPMFVNSDTAGPTIAIAQHQRRVVDFYFPLPAGVDDNTHLPAFDFLWTVRTPARAVAQRTSFTRMTIEPAPRNDIFYAGWGPVWWANPWYPHAWWGPRVVVVHGFYHHR
jgi:hypothetical protein